MIQLHLLILLSAVSGGTSNMDSFCPNGLKYIKDGGNISLNCMLSSIDALSAWFKQTPGEKSLLIASAYLSLQVTYHNKFDNNSRFTVLRNKGSFSLSISNAKPSDSATYSCVAVYFPVVALIDCTVLVLGGAPSSQYTVLQHPVLDGVELGGNTTLECTVFTEHCSEDHSVSWFRHGSGEPHPGIIYTHVNSDDQCKKSSETDSTTQSCVYKLPKTNLSLSDTGTYYCAVAACGDILFGNGTKLDFAGNYVLDPTIIVLSASNIILIIMVLVLCKKIHNIHHKDAARVHAIQANPPEDNGGLNYAALSFTQPPSSRRNRTKNSSDQPVYAQVQTHF